jgi:hypothetical protein
MKIFLLGFRALCDTAKGRGSEFNEGPKPISVRQRRRNFEPRKSKCGPGTRLWPTAGTQYGVPGRGRLQKKSGRLSKTLPKEKVMFR